MTQKKYTSQELEKYSSAFTLSDMEIFIFPDIFYSLVLANIMSPIIWEWKKDPWFDHVERKSFTYKLNRIKQYIMEKTIFNLDLDTWGLTTKEKEVERFKEYIDTDTLRQSNALFGYEGDKYYFKIDIRRHFGLDKYESDIIPYWKTETIEAMMAFAYRDNSRFGAGECVSLSSLYAAALFVIGEIPLEKIFLIATPLHSQNFILEKEGVLTNNRRLVTKKMWYNATELTLKARRAIENEQITIVSHITGHIHTIYKEASIDPAAYDTFSDTLTAFLETPLTFEIFINFLRTKPDYWNCFQYRLERNKKECYIDLHTIYRYESTSKNSLANESRFALLEEMDATEFHYSHNPKMIILNDFEEYLKNNPKESIGGIQNHFFRSYLENGCAKMTSFFTEIKEFIKVTPRLPEKKDKKFIKEAFPLEITTQHTREEIIKYIHQMRSKNQVADYAMYAYRKMDEINWTPFVKAAIERNPVCLDGLAGRTTNEAYESLQALTAESIYSDNRLAQPDEVWNFKRGDGLEKAFVLMNYILKTNNPNHLELKVNNDNVELIMAQKTYSFSSNKNLTKNLLLSLNGQQYTIEES